MIAMNVHLRRSLAAALCAALFVTLRPAYAEAANDVELNVLLPLTGPAAFLGKEVATSLGLIKEIVNKGGGIKGRPITFAIADDQSSPQVTVQLTNQLIAKKVNVILGPSFTQTCAATAALVAADGPLNYCYSPGIIPAPGSYVFSANAAPNDLGAVVIRYFRERGWTHIAVITSTDATGQVLDKAFASAMALPENKNVEIVAQEHFNATDVSVSAQMARIKSLKPQALIAWTTGTAFGTLLHGINDAGLDIPIAGGNGNMSQLQLSGYQSFAPKQLYFPGVAVITGGTSQPGPTRDAQQVFASAMKAAGLRPDFSSQSPWDATMIVIDALRHLGPDASAASLRDYIENLHGWHGLYGEYDFRTKDQRGIGPNAIVIDRWDAAKSEFIAASLPGGQPLGRKRL